MTGNQYQELARRTQSGKLLPEQKLQHAIYGMTSEVGEINSIFQHQLQDGSMNYLELKGELGDLIWFICEFCDAHGWTLEDVMVSNIEKLKQRYPDGFSRERSIHRHEIEHSEGTDGAEA